MRRSNEWRVYGPYQHGKQWRIQFSRGSRKARQTRYEAFATRIEAEACITGARDEAQGTTVRQAVDRFIARARMRGLVENTIDNYEFRLARLLDLPRNANKPLRWIRTRGAELYRATTKGAASDTHINGLNIGRMWGAFCVKEKLLKVNPFAGVEPHGRKARGADKPRLSVDESRVLEAHCFEHADDPNRVLTYAYLMLGKRASELTGITARDLDDDGWLIRIRRAKTVASIRPIPVPERLREMLLGLAKGKTPDAPLFTNMSGEAMSRFVARDRVRAVLKAAGVTVQPPQALRRTFTDNAERQGFALRSIAEQVGHTSASVTRRSYMSPETLEAGRVERNLKVIQGGQR